mmetsp:Transcript_22216/g.67474  ORF Transcript_22216/g.67474 Transcript_22216/m.67474 type:complete len:107 (+) Transcript_22216:3630-3950(+)|eukprot:scaffold63219_cov33-Tisochrysis_lutea.AAC.7
MARNFGSTTTRFDDCDHLHAIRRIRLGFTAPKALWRLEDMVARRVVPVIHGLLAWGQLKLSYKQLPVLKAFKGHAVWAAWQPVLHLNLTAEALGTQGIGEAKVSRA